MPRQARLDAPGTLHHVIIRGIEQRPIVDDDEDRKNFVDRMGSLALETDTTICAWALMTNQKGGKAWFDLYRESLLLSLPSP